VLSASEDPEGTIRGAGASYLASNLCLSVFGSLFEIFAGLDQDSRVSVLNLNVVDLPESLPDPPIND
jgi:hypothetical protein